MNGYESPLKGKRILFVSSLFPPDVMGGAEMSAYNLAQWLKSRGADVAVLTTAKKPEEELRGEELNGLKTWREWMPRPYAMFDFPRAPQWKKPFWHLQDHFDSRNREVLGRVLGEFRPEVVNVHVVQGLGHNSLLEIAERDIPAVYFLHDLGLGCIRMSMFKSGSNCASQCITCMASSAYKLNVLKKFRRLSFVSPSKANLEKLNEVFPVKRWPHAVLLNANKYPEATIARSESRVMRFLYAGRIHPSKGVELLLAAAKKVVDSGRTLRLTIAGSGPAEESLRRQYAACNWLKFTGFIGQSQLSNEMVNHDFLCIPSIWAENSPGVVIHALGLGLPVIGSGSGGIPELITHKANGLIVGEASIDAWSDALMKATSDRAMQSDMRRSALQKADAFRQEIIGQRLEAFIATAIEARN